MDDWSTVPVDLVVIVADREPVIIPRSIDRWQREIVVTQEQWLGHVLGRHHELADSLEAIGFALTDPDFVMLDTRRRNRETFYRSGCLPPPIDHLYLKVVVEFRHTGGGEVLTAFPLSRIKKRYEVRKWP